MKYKCLCLFTFITSISLLLASLTFASREEAKEACADDYGTYIHPGPTATHVTCTLSRQIGEFPVLVHLHPREPDACEAVFINDAAAQPESSDNIPIYLSCRHLLI